ncbi:MAG: hypothetical protein ACRDIB_05610 [Ardenticatenaceae bacterium]
MRPYNPLSPVPWPPLCSSEQGAEPYEQEGADGEEEKESDGKDNGGVEAAVFPLELTVLNREKFP